MELELVNFIKDNPRNWEEILSNKPYSITIKRDGGYVLFSYSMIDSDFSLSIVKECRGMILREDTLKPVCVPFFKFFNVQEGNAAKIDWNSARVTEKVDGSLIKVWYDDAWRISTNNTIFAYKAELQLQTTSTKNYRDLFLDGLDKQNVHFNEFFYYLDKDYTYMFEVVSPLNRVVVPYPETEIYHIGTRNNTTLKEENTDIGIRKPNEYNLYTLDDCLNAVADLPFSEEGYVVVDRYFNRVKIKSPAYVAAHHIKNNGVITNERILNLLLLGEQSEFLGYFPEYTEMFDEASRKLNLILDRLEYDWHNRILEFSSRAEFAQWANKQFMPSCMYSLLDGKYFDPKDWLYHQSTEKISSWMERIQ